MRHVYDNLGSFIADAKRTPLNSNPSSRATSGEFNGEWSGTKTFEEAVDLAINGWPEGRKRLMTAMAAAQSAPAFTPSLAMDVAGAYPIAALAEAPDPDGADAFVEFVLSDEGQAILAAFGFERLVSLRWSRVVPKPFVTRFIEQLEAEIANIQKKAGA
jgi:hypothetical protein